MGTRNRRWLVGGAALVIVVTVAYVLVAAPRGSRSLREFDPDRMASLELRMWQAYYAKERVRLFGLLVTLLREQYHYSWARAVTEGYHVARAATTFGDAREHYEDVLPDLEAAYGTAQRWLDARFDPREVARAELAWWVARRTPGEDAADHVGSLMADLYAMLYEAPRARVERAAVLRARAAALRDAQAQQPDWGDVAAMLTESYRELRAGLDADRPVR